MARKSGPSRAITSLSCSACMAHQSDVKAIPIPCLTCLTMWPACKPGEHGQRRVAKKSGRSCLHVAEPLSLHGPRMYGSPCELDAWAGAAQLRSHGRSALR